MNDNRERQTSWASAINIIAALWLIFSPYILGSQATAVRTNDIIVGLAVGILAIIRVSRFTEGTSWLSYVNGILGLWLLASPLFISYLATAEVTNNIITGIIVAFLGFLSAYTTNHPESIMQRPRATPTPTSGTAS
jgi:hypothetical protein